MGERLAAAYRRGCAYIVTSQRSWPMKSRVILIQRKDTGAGGTYREAALLQRLQETPTTLTVVLSETESPSRLQHDTSRSLSPTLLWVTYSALEAKPSTVREGACSTGSTVPWGDRFR